MKKLLTAILLFITTGAIAQITLEHVYPNGYAGVFNFRVVHFSSAGYKYAYGVHNGSSETINIYNLNHSLYKTINVPTPATGFKIYGVYYLSDSLFNTTTSDIEYYVQEEDTNYITSVKVYNDAGNVLFSKDSVIAIPATWPNAEPVVYTSTGYKLILVGLNAKGNPDDTVSVYSLPGALPCSECSNGVLTGSISPMNPNGNSGYLSSPYPNPNAHSASIKYQLPDGVNNGQVIFYDLSGKEIKRYAVDRTFDSLELTTTDLAPGTYLYILQTANGNIGNKKMVVIK